MYDEKAPGRSTTGASSGSSTTSTPLGKGGGDLRTLASSAIRPDLHAPAGAVPAPVAGGDSALVRPSGSAGGDPALVRPSGSAGGEALPGDVRAKMEAVFGADFSAVRIYEDGEADAIGAQAYTRGNDIHFAPGAYQPHTEPGQELLAHELAHVVQQAQGRVAATTQARGQGLNNDAALEREADEHGARAARGEPIGGRAGARVTADASSAPPVVQRMAKHLGNQALQQAISSRPSWRPLLDDKDGKPALYKHLEEHFGGTPENPYAGLKDRNAVRQAADDFFRVRFASELGHSKAMAESPPEELLEEGRKATEKSTVLTEVARKLAEKDGADFRAVTPQWVPVNGGIKGDDPLFYRFCDYNEIDRMLPRVLWETYDDTAASVKAKKGGEGADHTLTWSAPQHRELKGRGMESLDLAKTSAAPHKEKAVLDRAQQHMGDAQTRLSPFVSLSEDPDLLVNSQDPTMQSIVRSDANLVDVPAGGDLPQHSFHTLDGTQRARGYQRAPHLVKFQIPPHLIITPEMCDAHRGLTAEEIADGLGLKAMREAKERLFLGGEIWKYAVEVAANPY